MKYYIVREDDDPSRFILANDLLSAINMILHKSHAKDYTLNIKTYAGIPFIYLNIGDREISIEEKQVKELPCWIE